MTTWAFNPFTGTFDQVGAGSPTTPGGSDTQLQFNDGGAFGGNSALTFNKTTGVLTLTGAPLALTGNISAASWELNGLKIKGGTSTLTDTSAAGTVATGATNVFGGNTIAATNARTITDYYSAYINAPVAGTNVTLTNKWALGLAGNLKITGGTVTASAPVLDLSQTWNNAGVTFTGIKANYTDTASASGSLLMDLQVGGASKLSVDKTGQITARGTTTLIGSGSSTAGCGIDIDVGQAGNNPYLRGFILNSKVVILLGASNTSASAYGSFGQLMAQTLPIGFNSGSDWNTVSGDVLLYRDAAAILAQRNSTNAQTFRTYGTYTDASNYRRVQLSMSTGGTAELKPEGAGTGASDNVLHISGLPTSNPGAGILWNDSGTVKVGT